ncbi:MAG: ArnT family glycosyltransferase, partial [Candidatus Binataceae bacterium]
MPRLDSFETEGEPATGNRLRAPLSGFHGWIEALLDRVAEVIGRNPLASAGTLVALILLVDLAQSSTTRLWNDELETFDVSTLSFSRMFAALNAGLDSQPPLSYMLVRLSHLAVGTGEVATRLPFILGFAAASLLLFAFIYQRCDAVWGIIAVLFLWLTDAFRYSIDARPYALVLASCAASFVLWRQASEGGRPRLASGGLAIVLALGVGSHFYAILLVVPLAIGELVRSVRSRRLAPRIWIALGACLTPLLFARRQIASLSALYEGDFWSKPELRSLLDTYVSYLDLKAFSVTLLIVILLTAYFKAVPTRMNHDRRELRFEPHELAAVIALALLPLFVLALAFARTNAYVDRYALPATIGMSILFVIAVHIVLDGDARRAVLIACVLLVAFLGFRVWPALRAHRFGDQYLADSIRTAKTLNGPIVVTSPQLFEFLNHYLDPAERAR